MKLRQIDDAMSVNFKDTPLFEEWRPLKSTTDNAALERHRLAHNWVIIDPFEQPGRRWKLRPPVGKQRQPPELREILPTTGVLCVRDIWQIARRFTALCLTLHNFARRLHGQPELFSMVPDTTGPTLSLAELTREVQRLANSEPGAEEQS